MNHIKNNTVKTEELFEDIKNLECDEFSLYFFKALALKNKDAHLIEAKMNIDKAISLLNKVDNGIIENGIVLWHRPGNGLSIPINIGNKHFVFAQVYFTSGEIYARLQEFSKSIDAYKKAQYYLSFLKSEFEKDSISLFSFRKFNQYTLSDLIENKITVSPSKYMNDPFDSLINLWANEENLAQKCKDKSHAIPYAKSFDYFRIRSFCYGKEDEVVKKSLMWSHYAEEHKGFCVKYHLSSRFIKQEENSDFTHTFLKKIQYTDESINLDKPTIDTNFAFATKSSEWSYEKEVRLIDYNPNIESPYYGIALDDSSYVDAIYFGYRCEERTISTIKKLFSHNERNTKFFKMRVNTRDVYNMDFIQI